MSTNLVKIYKEWVFFSIHHYMDKRLEYAVNAQNSETEKKTFEDILVKSAGVSALHCEER